ncbi:hypothetical protein DFH08DRAFT_824823 [Mycena albidolilacea]|uniref:Uncharacterized protein n=1 Tax=Mycena albidolilacea TaxID=1033008 RepID=A0AAD6Z354_9AGAR|nr:hypothetical protein DFH08DRAFT_824823 [Mycena albidolilacea]
MSSPTSTSRMTRAQTRGRLSAKTGKKPATSASIMPLESLRSQQENIELNAIAHRTRRSVRAQQIRNSLNGAEKVRSATHGGAQAAPGDAVTDANDLNDTDGDERADVTARTASTPEAQGQSESVGGDSDKASEEMPENYDIAALDNGNEGSFARHVRRRRESRLRVIHRSSNGVHSVRQLRRQGEHDNEDSESDSENGSWDWYYEQRAAHKKNSKGDESDDDSGITLFNLIIAEICGRTEGARAKFHERTYANPPVRWAVNGAFHIPPDFFKPEKWRRLGGETDQKATASLGSRRPGEKAR